MRTRTFQSKKANTNMLFYAIPTLILLLILIVFGTDFYIKSSTQTKIFEDLDNIPHNKVGLLLGTVKVTGYGTINRYYQYRIDAAEKLFKAGKIEYILVSGDNSRKGYDEPTDMKNDLIARGIPESRIVLDYAGFRTLDSVVRSKLVFGQEQCTIISQKFHNERALFLARFKGIDAVAFNAQEVTGNLALKVQIREKLARVKVLLDLLLGVGPKFWGPQIKI